MNDPSSEDDLIGSLIEILMDRQRAGEPVEFEAMCEQHPDLADRLRSLYETIRVMEENKPSRDFIPLSSDGKSGTRIGDYQILREIARGGMGIVYEAIQLSLGRHVALKVIAEHLLNRQSGIARFRREARAAAQLHHSNIVPVFDVGQEGSTLYYAMQYIPGQSLDQVIEEMRRSRLDTTVKKQLTVLSESIQHSDWSTSTQQQSLNQYEAAMGGRSTTYDKFTATQNDSVSSSTTGTPFYRNVARVGLQIAEALTYAHGRGILHRDIKPSNILVDLTGTAWVTDFGLAKANDSSDVNEDGTLLTHTGDIVGTLRYLAPECLQGKQDHRVDIYGLGATIYELLTQQPLFDAVDRTQLLAMVSHQEPTRLRKLDPKVPRDLETIVQKCIAKDAQFRYRSAQLLADDLRLFLLDRPIQSRRTTWMEKTSRWCRKNPAIAGLSSVAATMLLILAAVFLVNKSLQWQRDEAIDLYQRKSAAENQSRVRAILNDAAAYRMTLAPELVNRRRALEAIEADDLPDDLRFTLRNEIAASLTRADWYPDDILAQVGADTVAAIDRSRTRLAEADRGKITIRNRTTGKLIAENDGVGFIPTSMRFSRNGKYLLVYGTASQLEIVRCEDVKSIHLGPQIVVGCDVSDAKDIAVYWHADQRISIESIDQATAGKVLLNLQTASQVTSCRLSPQGERVAYTERGDVCVIDAASGKRISAWPCDQPSQVEWSPNGLYLAIVGAANQIQIWDLANNECVNVLDPHATVVSSLDWDPSSQYLLSQTWDGTTQVTHAWSRKILVRSKKALSQPEFSSDGKALGYNVAEGKLQNVRWNPGLAPEIPFNPRNGNSSPISLAIHPRESCFAVSSIEQATLFDITTSKPLAQIPVHQPIVLEFASDGNGLYVLGKTAIQFWPIANNSSDSARQTIGPPEIRAIKPISTGFIVTDANMAIVTTEDGALAQLNLQTAEIEKTLGPSRNFTVARLGNDQCVLYQWLSPLFEFWNFRKGNLLGQLNLTPGTQAFSDPGFQKIFTTNSAAVQVWDSKNMQRYRAITLDAPLIGAQIAFSPTAQEIAMQMAPHQLSLLDAHSYEPLLRLESNFEAGYTSLHYTPSGDYLIGVSPGTDAVRVWKLAEIRKALGRQGLNWQTPNPSAKTHRDAAHILEFDTQAEKQEHNSIQIASNLGELGETSHAWSPLSLAHARSQFEQSPEDPIRRNNYAWQLLMADRSLHSAREAESLAKQAFDSANEEPTYRNTYALSLYRAGKLDEAESLLRKNLDASAPRELTYDLIVLAMIAKSRGQTESAHQFRIWFEQNLAQHPPKLVSDRQELNALLDELKQIAE